MKKNLPSQLKNIWKSHDNHAELVSESPAPAGIQFIQGDADMRRHDSRLRAGPLQLKSVIGNAVKKLTNGTKKNSW